MNLSRVIGPPIGALLYARFDASSVFAVNAVTYLFAVVGLLWATYPATRTHASSNRASLGCCPEFVSPAEIR